LTAVIVHDLGPEAVGKMTQVDLAGLSAEPESPIGSFPFHGCNCGVSAFAGRPPWELHTAGDELLLVLAGSSELTVIEGGELVVRSLSKGQLAVVPEGHWHRGNAPTGVTLLWMTPIDGNEHSWSDPPF
jgi:hypothetical protein